MDDSAPVPEHRLGANLGLLIPCAHGENLQKLVKVAALLNPEGLLCKLGDTIGFTKTLVFTSKPLISC